MPRAPLVHFDDSEVSVVRYYAYEATSDAKSSGISSKMFHADAAAVFGHHLDKSQARHTCRIPLSHCILMHVELTRGSLARGFLQLHHMAFLQNSNFTLLHLHCWYIKYTSSPNKHCLIDASRRYLALAFSRLAGARVTAPAGGVRRRVVVGNRDFSDSEHIGWKDTDIGLSKVSGLVLNYEQREGDPLYLQCVWSCCQFLEEDVQLGLLSFRRWIIIPSIHHCLPSSIQSRNLPY